MNAKGILDQLMKEASSSRSRGNSIEDLLGNLSKGLSSGGSSGAKGLIGGSALGLLLGSKRGRKMGGKALKYGALAGVGVLAWKAWQNYQGSEQHADTGRNGDRIDQLSGEAGETRSRELLHAMLMAARADGHIDAAERASLTEQIDAMGADDELHAWVEEQLSAPLDADALARQADSPQAAREMYLASAAIIDEQNAMERAWLDELARALGIDSALATELERQAVAEA